MSDWRETDPAGCVHRFDNLAAAYECRRYPGQMGAGGSHDYHNTMRFPICTKRCGEFDEGPPEPINLAVDLTPEQLAAFKRAWGGGRAGRVLAVEPARIDRNPGAAYGHPPGSPPPPADED